MIHLVVLTRANNLFPLADLENLFCTLLQEKYMMIVSSMLYPRNLIECADEFARLPARRYVR